MDIVLWKILTGRAPVPEPDIFHSLLTQFSGQDFRIRLPFTSVLDPALAHPSPDVRAAAIKILAGFDGLPALRHIVHALNDKSASVRRAAVGALSLSTSQDPARFAHALFHADRDVRSQALTILPSPSLNWFALFHLEDVPPPPEAAGCLQDAEVPVEFLPEVFDLLDRERLEPDSARQILVRMGGKSILKTCIRDRPEAHRAARALLRAAGKDDFPSSAPGLEQPSDLFYKAVDLFWSDPPNAFLDSFIRLINQDIRNPHKSVIAATLIQVGAVRGSWPSAAAGVCALTYPRFLGFPWVPLEVRRAAVASLYAHASGIHYDKTFVKQLLQLEICRRSSGRPDLWVMGGILNLLKETPYRTLLQWIPLETIVEAAQEYLDDAFPFLSLEDKSKQGQSFLIDAIASAAGTHGPAVMAMMACAGATDRLEKLIIFQNIKGSEASAVTVEVLRLTMRPDVKLTARKETLLGRMLGERLEDKEIGRFIECLISVDHPHKSRFGITVLETLSRRMKADAFASAVLDLESAKLRKLLDVIDHCDAFPLGKEMKIASRLVDHADPEVRKWAMVRTPSQPEPPPTEKAAWSAAATSAEDAISMTPDEMKAIAESPESDLPKRVAPCLMRPTRGLTDALADRPAPTRPIEKSRAPSWSRTIRWKTLIASWPGLKPIRKD